jgi:multiple sugar transport system permease protein
VIALVIGMAGGYAFARFKFRGKTRDFPGLDAVPHGAGYCAVAAAVLRAMPSFGMIDTQIGHHHCLRIAQRALHDLADRRVLPSNSDVAVRGCAVDGCTRWQAFWKIEFPLARSGIAAAGVFAFLTSWNEFALASQLTRSTDSKTCRSA